MLEILIALALVAIALPFALILLAVLFRLLGVPVTLWAFGWLERRVAREREQALRLAEPGAQTPLSASRAARLAR
jgi:hypothetical protein